MHNGLVLSIIAVGFFSLLPVSFAEYYYHEYPSWSIEYPDGWNVTDLDNIDAVIFSDGSEVGRIGEIVVCKNS